MFYLVVSVLNIFDHDHDHKKQSFSFYLSFGHLVLCRDDLEYGKSEHIRSNAR